MKKIRLLALLLTIITALTLCGVNAFADESIDGVENSSEGTPESAPDTSADSGDDSSPVWQGYAISYGYKPLVAPDGTKASRYIKGTTPATAYVAPGDSHTVAKNDYKFRDYVFAGWSYNGKLYQPNEVIYNVQEDMTLIATWVRPQSPDMTVIGIIGYSEGGNTTVTQSVNVGDTVKLQGGTWQDGSGRIFEGGSSFLLSFTEISFVPYSGGGDTLSVSYNGNGATGGVQCGFKVENGKGFLVDGCYGTRDGYNFVGWTDGAGKVYRVGDTCNPEGDTVLTATWQAVGTPAPDYRSVSLTAGQGGYISPQGKVTVVKGEKIEFSVVADSGYVLSSVVCDGQELGNGGSYVLTVNGDMSISASFTYVGGDTESKEDASAEDESEQDSTLEEESSPEITESTGVTVTDDETSADKTEGDKAPKNIFVIIVAVLCCGCGIVFAIWFVSKAQRR